MVDTQKDWRALTGDAAQTAALAKADADAAKALALTVENSMKSAALVWEYTFTITQALPISLALTTQRFSAPAAKAEVGDLVLIHPTARPTFSAITIGALLLQSTGFVYANGAVDVSCILPPISIAGTLSMPIRLRGFRPAAV